MGVLAWSVLVEFYLDLFHLPLAGELVLQPVVAVLAMMSVVAGRDEKHRHVGSCIEALLALFAIGLLAFVTVKTVQGWEELDGTSLVTQFALPAWLTIGALPFIFFLAIYAGYESAFLRIDLQEGTSRWCRLRSKLALASVTHLHVREIATFPGYWLRKMTEASSFRKARAVVRSYRLERRTEAEREVLKNERLKKLAGVKGADADGRQLDRREFDQTTDALRWLGTCMMGWHKKGKRYQDDLLERINDSFDRFGLDPLGIEMRVSDDGQAWYAWRRTVTGWCFAIGAAGPPPDQWEYDGPNPPRAFPGIDLEWGSSAFSEAANPNW